MERDMCETRITRLMLLCGILVSGCVGEVYDVQGSSSALRTMTQVSDFGSNPGGLKMFVHEPASPAASAGVVVVLHGCTMSAGGQAEGGWNDVADELGFYVVYPEQSTSNNSLSCFNWGGSWAGAPNAFVASSTPVMQSDIERGGPEVTSIHSMVEHMVATHGVDPDRVFVSGLSAGGAMAAVLLASYPDVFGAGQIVAGVPYKCATTTGEATGCMGDMSTSGLDRTPADWASLVASSGAATAPAPRVSIWHGTNDFVVHPSVSDELVEQWSAVHGATRGSEEDVEGATRVEWVVGGRTVVERWTVHGMTHGVPVDPASGCGGIGSYINDVGICSARHGATFFGLDGAGPEPGPEPGPGPAPAPGDPVVGFESPANGAFLDGVVGVTITASDDEGISRINLYVDDALVASSGSETLIHEWDTVALAEGAYRLRAEARDAGGAIGSATIQVVVDRPGGITPTDPTDPTDPGPETDPGPGTDPGSGTDPGTDPTEPRSEGRMVAGCAAGGGRSGALVALALLAMTRRRSRRW